MRSKSLDPNALNELTEVLGKPVTVSIVRLFERETRRHFTQLEVAVLAGASVEQQRLVHKLRGSGLQVGTDALAALCDDLETDLRRDPRPLGANEMDRLRSTVTETLEALGQWLKESEGEA